MKEKGITLIILILVIISVIGGILIINTIINNNGKKKQMKELEEITAKACLITNFEVTTTSEDGNTILVRKIKDNLQKDIMQKGRLREAEIIRYYNKDKNKKIFIMPKKKIIWEMSTIDRVDEYDIKNAIDYTLESLNRKNKYKYEGIKKDNGKKFYVVKYNKEIFDDLVETVTWLDKAENPSNINKIQAYGYIDMDTGFIVKEVMYYDKEMSVKEWNIKINCITDEEMEEPDLTGYKNLKDQNI